MDIQLNQISELSEIIGNKFEEDYFSDINQDLEKKEEEKIRAKQEKENFMEHNNNFENQEKKDENNKPEEEEEDEDIIEDIYEKSEDELGDEEYDKT